MPLTEFEKGLFVGLLEGEGSLSVYKSTEKRKPGKRTRSRLGFTLSQNIRIHNTNTKLLTKVQAIFGGKIYRSGRPGGPNRADRQRTKDMYAWLLADKQKICDLLSVVLKHLIIKKSKAQLLIAFCKCRLSRPSLKAGYTEAEIACAENWAALATNPLTKKGNKILAAMIQQYGKKKGTAVFYASINKGKLHGVHK